MSNTTPAKKITKATFKSFVNKNRASLFVNVTSSFDGMTDCCESRNGGFREAKVDPLKNAEGHTLGVNGIWLVGQSRDYFTAYESAIFTGIEVYNSCGCFIVAVRKDVAAPVAAAA